MSTDATFKSFEKELNRLVDNFERQLGELKSPDYVEAKLREDFLNPFFHALGWDLENRAGLIQSKREVEIESRTQIMPKLRAAKSEAERKTLQNAVTATDQQIDALVYDLYGLTARERGIVEASQPSADQSSSPARPKSDARPAKQIEML